MSKFFYGIQDLFVNVLFKPFDWLRELSSWWGANSINWIFVLIGMVAFAYWLKQLKIFSQNNEEDMSSTSHSYL